MCGVHVSYMDSIAGFCQESVPEGMAISSSKQCSLLSAVDDQMCHNIDVVCLQGGCPFLPARAHPPPTDSLY